jgi:hypothetical protein
MELNDEEHSEPVSEPSRRVRHMETHRERARRTFAQHVITKESDRRWLLQRLYEDGRPDWTYAAEIIVLENASIFVGGDIDHVIFGHGPADPLARLRWMGEHRDLGYYVAQKARIGTGKDLVDIWDEDVAREELRDYAAQNEAEDEYELESAFSADNENDFYRRAMEAFGDGYDAHEAICGMGRVLAPRVIYAHAALARLCELLRARS